MRLVKQKCLGIDGEAFFKEMFIYFYLSLQSEDGPLGSPLSVPQRRSLPDGRALHFAVSWQQAAFIRSCYLESERTKKTG